MEKWYTVFAPETLWDTYWNELTIESNLASLVGDALLPIFLRYLKPEHVVLEAGCGLGKWVVDLAERGYTVVGLDSHEPSLERLKEYRPGSILVGGSVVDMPLATGSIDVCISLGVIEHFEAGPRAALAELYRVLKPGGLAIVEVPFDNLLRRAVTNRIWRAAVVVKRRLGTPFYFSEYRLSADELTGHLRAAGFEILATRPKDYLQADKSIGLYMEFPPLRGSAGVFSLNRAGQVVKRVVDRAFPWSTAGCVVAVAQKP